MFCIDLDVYDFMLCKVLDCLWILEIEIMINIYRKKYWLNVYVLV